jgi:hypothetical protein
MRGLDYVGIAPGIAKDLKIVAIAKALGKDRRYVAGCFPEFFGNVAEHAPNGCLADVDDETLDAWAGSVRGFGALVREQLCDASGTLAAWYHYNGKALARLQQDRDRKRGKSAGDSMELPGKVHGTSTENGRNIRGDSTPLTDTDTDTDTGTDTSSTATASSGPSRAELEPLVRALLSPDSLEALDRLLRASGNPAGIVNDLARRLAVHPKLIPIGPSGRASDPRDVSAALIDLANGDRPTWNPRYFAGVLEKARERRELPARATRAPAYAGRHTPAPPAEPRATALKAPE